MFEKIEYPSKRLYIQTLDNVDSLFLKAEQIKGKFLLRLNYVKLKWE